MKKKILLAAGLVIAFAASSLAAPVDTAAARKVAVTQLKAAGMHKTSGLENISEAMPFKEFYVFSMASGGFVLVSGDDCVVPVLGYSATATFPVADMPDNVASWLSGYETQINRARRFGRGVSPEVAGQWEAMLQGEMPPAPLSVAVSPLVSTTWNQSPRYNTLCPDDDGELTVTGCVATATAQVMKYWEHPAKGYGSHSYTARNSHTSYGTLSANFGSTTYRWSSMPSALNASSSTAQINAVATLMYHIGVADEMTYDISANGGSGANNYQYYGTLSASSQNSLVSYFKYRPDMATIARSDYSDADFSAMLRAEIDQSRPILYSGRNTSAGHSFVLDGYDNSGKFHVNWGWGGYLDGYFTMGSLNPGVGGIGGNSTGTYNMANVALVGIRPNTEWSTTDATTVNTSMAGGASGCAVSGGGTYSFGSTVTLRATAASGYRFDGWSDGSKFNPREFVATGGTYNFTARFVPMDGDTLTYCPGGHCINSYGTSGGETVWGIRLPSSVLDLSKSLTAVQLYVAKAGTYSLTVYRGTGRRRTSVYTASVAFTEDDADAWRTITLTDPVAATGDLWIVFRTNGVAYPAAFTYGSGAEGSFLWTSSLTDHGLDWDMTAMVRGIFRDISLPDSRVDGNCVITELPYTMDFEGGLACWTFKDANADGTCWSLADNVGYGDSRCATISYAPAADDWLTSPGIVGAGRYAVEWKAKVHHYSYPETYQVWAVGRDSSVKVFEETLTENASFANRSAEFLVDAGDTVAIRFRYISDNKDELYLDDIVISLVNRRYTLEALSADTAMGLAEGGGVYDSAVVATLTATPKRRFHFLRWSDGDTLNPRQITVLGDTSVLALFEANPPEYFTVSLASDDASRGSVSGAGVYIEDSVAFLSALPVYGYRFTQWNDGDTSNPRRVMVEADTSFTAYFDYDTNVRFTLTVFSSSDTMGTVSGGGSYASGSNVTLVASALPGNRLVQWNDGVIDSIRTVTVSRNASYLAIFESSPAADVTLALASENDTMGTVSGGGTYSPGTIVTIRAVANPGYRFVQWSDGNTQATRTVTVTRDVSLTARFAVDEPARYTFVVVSADTLMGSVIGSGVYTAGSIASLQALPMPGYRFLRWDDGYTRPLRTVVATSNATFVAFFELRPIPTYTLSVVAADSLMGSVSGGGVYDSGSVAVISAVATEGHHFVRWSDGDTSAARSVIVESDTVYTALFRPDVMRFTLDALSADTSMGTVVGGGVYDSAAVVRITAAPREGYHFVRWSDGDTISSRLVTLVSDTSFTAYFATGSTGIPAVEAVAVAISPNPAVASATVSWSTPGVAEVSVFGVNGSKVAAYRAEGGSLTLDVSGYTRGVYLVRVATGDAVLTRRLVVR